MKKIFSGLLLIVSLLFAEEKICPKCESWMIKVEDEKAKYVEGQKAQIWWCNCGYTEKALPYIYPTSEEYNKIEWEKAQERRKWSLELSTETINMNIIEAKEGKDGYNE